jgi:hypothetical protein
VVLLLADQAGTHGGGRVTVGIFTTGSAIVGGVGGFIVAFMIQALVSGILAIGEKAIVKLIAKYLIAKRQFFRFWT